MVAGRVRSRLRELQMENYTQYINHLQSTPSEIQTFVNCLTTNETYFYRTPRIWRFIEEVFLPEKTSQSGTTSLNLWSAAASTGAEAYTLGMLCEQHRQRQAPNLNYSIVASDIDSKIITEARKGVYLGRSIARLRGAQPKLFKEQMVGNDQSGFQVRPAIKDRLEFYVHNIFDTLPCPKYYDLILLRNVLIYFNKEDQKRAITMVLKKLAPGGYLIIGESESLSQLDVALEAAEPLVYRRPVAEQQAS